MSDYIDQAEQYIQEGIEGAYRRKLEDFFGGTGKKAAVRKVLMTLLEGASGFMGVPGIQARAWESAKEEYRSKAPLLTKDILAERSKEKQREADNNRLELKLLELAQKVPMTEAQIEKIRSEIGRRPNSPCHTISTSSNMPRLLRSLIRPASGLSVSAQCRS